MTKGLFLSAILALSAGAIAGPVHLELTAKTLSGEDYDLMQAAGQKPQIVVLGFSRASGDRSKAWRMAIEADLKGDTRVAVISLAMLGGAPGFIRPMIKSAMRSGMSPELQRSTVVVEDKAAAWRSYFEAELRADQDSPFVVAFGSDGLPACDARGSLDADKRALLMDCLKSKWLAPPALPKKGKPRAR